MHGVMATNPDLGEVVGVSSGQSLDEVLLLRTHDRRQIGHFEHTVTLEVTREERLFLYISFIHYNATGCTSSYTSVLTSASDQVFGLSMKTKH